MKVKLEVGAELDLLSPKEIDDSIQNGLASFGKMLTEGIRYGRVGINQLNSAGSLSNPNYTGGYSALRNGNVIIGPNPGYMWSIKNITFFNLPVNGVDIFVNDPTPNNVLFASLGAAGGRGTQLISSNAMILYHGNDLYVGFLATTTNASLIIYYEEVKYEDIGKL